MSPENSERPIQTGAGGGADSARTKPSWSNLKFYPTVAEPQYRLKMTQNYLVKSFYIISFAFAKCILALDNNFLPS